MRIKKLWELANRDKIPLSKVVFLSFSLCDQVKLIQWKKLKKQISQ